MAEVRRGGDHTGSPKGREGGVKRSGRPHSHHSGACACGLKVGTAREPHADSDPCARPARRVCERVGRPARALRQRGAGVVAGTSRWRPLNSRGQQKQIFITNRARASPPLQGLTTQVASARFTSKPPSSGTRAEVMASTPGFCPVSALPVPSQSRHGALAGRHALMSLRK